MKALALKLLGGFKGIGGWLLGQLLKYVGKLIGKWFKNKQQEKIDNAKIDQSMDQYEAKVEEIKKSDKTNEEKNADIISAFRDRD